MVFSYNDSNISYIIRISGHLAQISEVGSVKDMLSD